MAEAAEDTPGAAGGEKVDGSTPTPPVATGRVAKARPFDFKRLKRCQSGKSFHDPDRSAGSLTPASQMSTPPTTF